MQSKYAHPRSLAVITSGSEQHAPANWTGELRGGLEAGVHVRTGMVFGFTKPQRTDPRVRKALQLHPEDLRTRPQVENPLPDGCPRRTAKGRGLIAIVPIPAGTLVGVYDAPFVAPFRRLEVDALLHTGQHFYSYRTTAIDAIDGFKAFYVDYPEEPTTLTAYMSHSCEPNCKLQVTRKNGRIFLFLTTIRDVLAEEELTWNYSAVTDREDEQVLCACEAAKCSGFFVAFDRVLKRKQYGSKDYVCPLAMAFDRRLLPEEKAVLLQFHVGIGLLGIPGTADAAPWWLVKTAAQYLLRRVNDEDGVDSPSFQVVADMLISVRRYLLEVPPHLKLIAPIKRVPLDYAYRVVLHRCNVPLLETDSAETVLSELVAPKMRSAVRLGFSASERDIGTAYLFTKNFFTVPLEWLRAPEVRPEPYGDRELPPYNLQWLLEKLFIASWEQLCGHVMLPSVRPIPQYSMQIRSQVIEMITHGSSIEHAQTPPSTERPILIGSVLLDKYLESSGFPVHRDQRQIRSHIKWGV